MEQQQYPDITNFPGTSANTQELVSWYMITSAGNMNGTDLQVWRLTGALVSTYPWRSAYDQLQAFIVVFKTYRLLGADVARANVMALYNTHILRKSQFPQGNNPTRFPKKSKNTHKMAKQ